MKHLRSIHIVVLAAATLTACSGDTPTQPIDPATTVATISVSAPQTTVVVGKTVQLAAETSNAAGTVLTGKPVQWVSSELAVATVSPDGLVKGIAVGTTQITATSEGHSNSIALTVRAPNQVLLTSDADDFIATGASYSYTDDNAVILVTASAASIAVSIGGQQTWLGNFHAPGGAQIAAGTYTNVAAWPFQDNAPGLKWSGQGRECQNVNGSFTIDSIFWSNGVGSTLRGVDLRFEQHCELRAPALRGTIHWRSDDVGLWRPPKGAVPDSGDVVYLQSVPGDYIGRGATNLFQSDVATIAFGGPQVEVRAGGQSGDFQGTDVMSVLKPGFYGNARRYPYHDLVTSSLAWVGNHRGCNEVTGWFNVDRVSYANGALIGIELRFEQHCEGEGAALNGYVRWGHFTPPPSALLKFKSGNVTMLADDTLSAADALTVTDNSPVANHAIQYSSTDQAVVTVSSSGRVAAVSVGTAAIIAREGDISDALIVNVVPQFLDIAVGETHSCGITGMRELYCWGLNSSGELGVDSLKACVYGATSCSAVPVRVADAGRFVSVTVGLAHTCALTSIGEAYCWGRNLNASVGFGSETQVSPPTQVAGNLRFSSLASGRLHTCGITTNGDAYCWGWDYWGQLGGGSTATGRCNYFVANSPCSFTPVKVTGGQHFSKLWATEQATCGQTTANAMYCWGLQIGGSDSTDCQFGQIARCTRTPLLQASGATFPVLGMGGDMRCGQDADGIIRCWGTDFNNFGNGSPSKLVKTETPIVVAGGQRFRPGTLAVGGRAVCAINYSDTNFGANTPDEIDCWGDGSQGQVGGAVGGSRAFAAIVGYTYGGRTRLVSGPFSDTSCAIDLKGRAYCWGDGRFGQLGNGGITSSAALVPVKLIPRLVSHGLFF